MSKRLIEVATELNVGVKTIVDFLTGQGFEVSNKPTAKVSDDMYDALLRNFQKSIALKEQADQISTRKKEDKTKEKLKPWEKPTLIHKEPKSLHNPATKDELLEVPVLTETKEDLVKTAVVTSDKKEHSQPETTDLPKENATEESEKQEPNTLKGPKILGKIDLDAPKKQSHHPKQEHKSNQQPANKQQPQVNPNKQQPKEVEHKQPEPEKVVEVKPIESVEHPPKEDPIVVKTEKRVEDPVIEEMRAETPQLQGLKILGKINIEPAGKKKKKKITPKDQRPVGSGQPGNNNPRPEGQQQHNRSNDPKRQHDHRDNNHRNRPDNGQNKPEQNRSNAPANDSNKQPATNNAGGNNNNSNNNSNNADKKHRKKIKVKDRVATDNPTDESGDKRRAAGAGTGKPGAKDKKKEITTKEVHDSVKATMALMQGAGKRKKNVTRSERDERKERARVQGEDETVPVLQVTEFISVSELANMMEVTPSEVITACMKAGIFVSINQRLDAEVIELIAMEFGFEIAFVSAEDQIEAKIEEEVDAPEDLSPRAPIVTVMGHVDHGKTSLLDRIRKANVAEGEAGGITQHIGAYEVKMPGKGKITFLDTPGHEAFTAMRARGAKVTDIAVIIVAADDNVMPQTREAISHAQAAGVPIIFAINKIDKEGAAPEKIKQELASMGFLVEEWGGKYQSQEISAKKGLNIDLLLEKILLEAEILELKANPNRLAIGTVLEASLEKGRGYVAKMLIQTGTLHDGDVILAGQYYGRVKAMFNERGKRIKEAGPSAPVLVLGLQGAPQAGEKVKVMEDEREAKELASKRAQLIRQQQIRATRRITLGDINHRLKIGNFRELKLIVKCDMDGSVEALTDALIKLSTDQVQTMIVHKAVGPITESDVNLAAASDAIIIGFQVRPNPMAKKLAEQEGVEIKTYSIIYDAINEIKSALEGMLEPKQVEEELGSVEIQQVFNIPRVGTVAGCLVKEGKVTRNCFIRVVRNGIVVFPKKEGAHGKLASLKRFKENAMEVKSGVECGLSIEGFEDIKEGDMIEAYEIKEVKQTLESSKNRD